MLKLSLDAFFLQFEYNGWLAAECGVPVTEEWRKKMLYATLQNYLAHPGTYRDAWEDDDLVLEALMEMATVATLD